MTDQVASQVITEEQMLNSTDEEISQALSELKNNPVQEPDTVQTEESVSDVVGDVSSIPEDGGNISTENKQTDFVWDKAAYDNKSSEQLLEELQKRDKQVFYKEKMINDQAGELGKTREEIASVAIAKNTLEHQLQTLKNQKEDLFDEDQVERNIKDQALVEAQLNGITQQQSSMLFDSEIRSTYPQLDELINNEVPQIVATQMKAKGFDDFTIQGYINYFSSGQWKTAQGDDAVIVKEVLNRASYSNETNKLKREIEFLKKNSVDTARQVSDNIQKVASQSPIPTNGTGSQMPTYTEEELLAMSPEAFNELGKKLKRKT